jgi:sulfatase maturation enzyme AslB (radical SAM superfamily)
MIKNLVLVESKYCNLKCKYCEIAETVPACRIDENKKVRQAMIDDTYLINIMKTIDTSNIEKIQLWGEETLINLDNFFVLFNKLLKISPKLVNLDFSTNFTIDIEKLIWFIKNVDAILDRKLLLQI